MSLTCETFNFFKWEFRITCFDTIIIYHLFQKLMLLENDEFNHLNLTIILIIFASHCSPFLCFFSYQLLLDSSFLCFECVCFCFTMLYHSLLLSMSISRF